MIVISDTSPINYLCQLGLIEILPKLFETVVVPAAVVDELSRPAAPDSVRQFIGKPPTWLGVRVPDRVDPALNGFGIGEQQAIALAEELHADLLIADDKIARRAAEGRQLSVIGTLGVLKLASRRNLLHLSAVVERLRSIGFFVSDEVLAELLGET